MKELIISHAADWDGLFSAAIASSACPEAKIVLMNYNDTPPYNDMDEASIVYMLDFTLSMQDMCNYYKKTVLIDHHAPKLKELDEVIGWNNFMGHNLNIDGTESAASLAWRYFFPEKAVPPVVSYISTYDVFLKSSILWRYAYAFQLGLRIFDFSIETAHKLLHLYDSVINDITNSGATYQEYKKFESNKSFKDYSWRVRLGNSGVNALAILTSDTQSTFAEPILSSGMADVVLMINRYDNNSFKLSVRVAENCDFDASIFCKGLGGGGHKKASGCVIDIDSFLKLYTKGEI